MTPSERLQMVAPCGIDCGICELFTCGENPALMERLTARGIPGDKLPCPGCRAVEGRCPVIGETCATYACVIERRVHFCYQCEDFPCERLHPAADRADVLPHNLKIHNLCVIQKRGAQGLIKQSKESKLRYFQGKMAIGKGPQSSD